MEPLMRQTLHQQFRQALGIFRPPPGIGERAISVGHAAALAAYEETDRALLEKVEDFDDAQVELPLPLASIPSICRLLYLRQDVAVTPLTRLFFNLVLHPVTRCCVLGHFLVMLCRKPQANSNQDALPPAYLFEAPSEGGRAPQATQMEIQAVGSQRVLSLLAYMLRRIPQCGEWFARQLHHESWMEALQPSNWTEEDRRKKSRIDAPFSEDLAVSDLPGQFSVNLLFRLLGSRLFLTSSRHASWLLSVLHSLLVSPATPAPVKEKSENDRGSVAASSSEAPLEATTATATSTTDPRQLRWDKIVTDMHNVLSRTSVLNLCNFLCQAGSGNGSATEAEGFQMASEVLVALAGSQMHLEMVRTELMSVLAVLVKDIEEALNRCEVTSAEPSTLEARFLRVVWTLSEVLKCGSDLALRSAEAATFLEKAGVESLWRALDRTLERLDDTEVTATPAQRLLTLGVAPSAVRLEGAVTRLSAVTSATLASNVQVAPPKPLLNRLLPLIEAFFVLHNGTHEAEQDRRDKEEKKRAKQSEAAEHVFAEVADQSAVDRSRLGIFCKKHRRPLNALVKQTPALLNKAFGPMLKHLAICLDFDNKRAYFRAQVRLRRQEAKHDTIRLRVRRGEIFMDSYHQLRVRTGEEMRAKIQVQFQGEEAVDAGGVTKEWYSALAKEIFNPNYALFVQAGGKACTYHPNAFSYVNRDHLQFYHFIGRVIGKAIHDGQNLEAWFTRGFYKHMLGRNVIPVDLEAFDPEYFSNLKWMLDHDITNIIELTFSAESNELGQMKVVDLKPNGRNLPVTNENKHEYIQLMSEHKMTNSVRLQIDHFLKGLHEIVPAELLGLFDDKELELLISGLPDIDIEDLKANTEYHNYTPQSQVVQWFWKVLSEFNQEQRAWFLQFATGTSRVPVEGFKGLIGMRGPQKLSLHKAFGADRLPSAHTCFNQLDLPEYPSEDVLREKLSQAVSEGHEGFGFA